MGGSMNTERIISPQQFRNLTNMSRSKEFRLNGKKCLPPRVIIDGIVLGYRESDYLAWLETHTKEKPK